MILRCNHSKKKDTKVFEVDLKIALEVKKKRSLLHCYGRDFAGGPSAPHILLPSEFFSCHSHGLRKALLALI